MSEYLKPTNFDQSNIIEESFLYSDAEAGQANIVLQNPDQFSANDYVCVGELGSENAEIMQIQSISSKTATLSSNLLLKHIANTRITKLFGDKVRVYRAANVDGSAPDDGDFSLLSTITIQADQQFSLYTDSTGGSSYWYKKTYYNSYSGDEIGLAYAVAARGGQDYYTTIDKVRREAGMQHNRWIADDVIQEKLDAAISEVNYSLIAAGYSLPLDSIPAMIENATRLLAAGFLLSEDYGPEFSGTNKSGSSKIAQARDLLKTLVKGEGVLVDDNSEQLSKSGNISFYPNEQSRSNTPSEDYLFGITDHF